MFTAIRETDESRRESSEETSRQSFFQLDEIDNALGFYARVVNNVNDHKERTRTQTGLLDLSDGLDMRSFAYLPSFLIDLAFLLR